ncbi:MAG: hypothetical protein E7329_08690 [Clostridiales bacterium]|nr:hypothetical protein [Clostridiales bacterium]
MKGSRWMGRAIAENFLNDQLFRYYFILQCVNALLGLALVFVDAPVDEETGQTVINGFSLMLAMFLPPVEIYLLYKMRKERQPQKVRNWGNYYLVFFGVMVMVTMLVLAGLIAMTVSPAEGEAAPALTEYIAAVWMVVSCLFYLFMGLSARQLATLMENKVVNRSVMLVLVIVIGLVSADELIQMVQSLFTLSTVTLGTILSPINLLFAIGGRMMLAMLFYRAHRSWQEIASNSI